MSEFRPSQIAPFLEKDAKTLRRWCEAGVVPHIEAGLEVGCFLTGGGQWRLRGPNLQHVVAFIRERIPKTARRRKENAYPLAGDRTKTPREAWARALPGAWRWDGANSKRVHATPWGLIGKRSSPSEKHRFLEAIAKGHLEQAQNLREDLQGEESKIFWEFLLKTLGQHIKHISTESVIPPNFEPLTASRLAYQCGVSRRTFYRWFPGWRRAVQKLVAAKLRKKLFDEEGGIVAGDEGVDFDGMDARNGWRD